MKTNSATSWPLQDPPQITTGITILVVVAFWFSTIIVLGGQGAFNAGVGKPPIATLMALVGPPILFLLLLQLPAARAEFLKISPVWITAMQGLRILGGGFLFVYAFGHLPALFAFMAGYGDILVALLAPIMTAKLAMNPAFLKSRWLERFHYLGLLDFVGAVGSGLIVRGTIPLLENPEPTTALAQLPLALIPCFAVPLWICFHITALLQIRAARRSEGEYLSGAETNE